MLIDTTGTLKSEEKNKGSHFLKLDFQGIPGVTDFDGFEGPR